MSNFGVAAPPAYVIPSQHCHPHPAPHSGSTRNRPWICMGLTGAGAVPNGAWAKWSVGWGESPLGGGYRWGFSHPKIHHSPLLPVAPPSPHTPPGWPRHCGEQPWAQLTLPGTDPGAHAPPIPSWMSDSSSGGNQQTSPWTSRTW